MDDATLNAVLGAVAEQERAGLGEHPSPEELLGYSLGTLLEEEKELIRDHLALCSTCAGVVLDFNAFPDLEAPPGTRPLSEHEQARQRRTIEEAGRALLQAAESPSPRRSSWVAAGGWAAAAVFFLTSAGLTVRVAQLRQALPAAVRTDQVSATLTAAGEPDVVRSAEVQQIRLPAWAGQLALELRWDGLGLPPFTLELVGLEGEVLWRDEDVRRGPDGAFRVVLDRDLLEPGRYQLRLLGGAEGAEPLAAYPFSLIHETAAP